MKAATRDLCAARARLSNDAPTGHAIFTEDQSAIGSVSREDDVADLIVKQLENRGSRKRAAKAEPGVYSRRVHVNFSSPPPTACGRHMMLAWWHTWRYCVRDVGRWAIHDSDP